jgi:ABC-type lipoprotein release transport system permease subunit
LRSGLAPPPRSSLTFRVIERSAEIGVHPALGASRSRVRWVVIRQPLDLTDLGICLGVPSRAVDGLVFGVGPRDPATTAMAVSLILFVTVAAYVAPALRAARVDPMTAVRCE